MTRILPTNDHDAVLAELKARIEKLERQNFLLHAAIDGLPGLAVKVPDGIDVKPGASVKIGNAGKIGALGDKIGLSGNVETTGAHKVGSLESVGQVQAGSVKSLGDVNADGTVRGYAGVMAPYKGAMAQLGTVAEAIDTKADNAATAAAAAASTAANRATVASVNTVDTNSRARDTQLKNYVSDIEDILKSQIDALIDKQTPPKYGKRPPPVWG